MYVGDGRLATAAAVQQRAGHGGFVAALGAMGRSWLTNQGGWVATGGGAGWIGAVAGMVLVAYGSRRVGRGGRQVGEGDGSRRSLLSPSNPQNLAHQSVAVILGAIGAELGAP